MNRPVRVVDISRPIPQPKDLAELGHVNAQRVVGRILRVMGIEAPRRPFDLRPRPQDGAIEIEREPAQAKSLDLVVDPVTNQSAQSFEAWVGEGFQPTDHGPVGRKTTQAAEAQEHKIHSEKGQVSHATAAHDEEPHHTQQDAHEPVVAVMTLAVQTRSDLRAEAPKLEESADELQPTVCRDALLGEGDRKIPDPCANLAFRYPHNSGPPMLCDEACNSIHSTDGATFFLTFAGVRLFSDQG